MLPQADTLLPAMFWMFDSLCVKVGTEVNAILGSDGRGGPLSSSSSSGGGSSTRGGGSGQSVIEPMQARAQCAALIATGEELAAALNGFPAGAGEPASLQLLQRYRERLLPPATRLSVALQEHWQRPEQLEADRLELARAAGVRSCAYLRCANLEGGGGRVRKCSACKAPYCGTACSHADWREGHKRVCKALAAERAAGEGPVVSA